ncbi:proton-conducting transporter membrane subunit [Rickettsia endosymbiont of Halotydeus destructor]|uniref:proton-conducting transporter transmembrane domain-containing protein n=1 Tax=Rickettsia endosymbiont of Halotydeus destructor TaxID=2996754 RepID=UPI003BAF6FEF
MFIQNNLLSFPLTSFTLIFDFSPQNKLIALAFLIIAVVTGLYAVSQNRKTEALIGSLYCLSSLTCLFAGDFISMVIFLEFMTIFACVLIFYGDRANSMKFARQYFLTHLFSSGLILIGISFIIAKTNDIKIISLTELASNYDLPAILILIGCLINIGCVFFNGWMVNCYPAVSSSSFIYLISFTSKVGAIILLKLFSGLAILKFFGIAMIIYGMIYALIEQNLKRLLCYLNIAQLGFIVIAISINSNMLAYAVTGFLFIHILYNGLLAIYIAVITDSQNIKNYSELKNISLLQHPILLISLIVGISIAAGLPIFASFTTKIALMNLIEDNIGYYAVLFLKISSCIILFSIFLEHGFLSKPSTNSVKFPVNFILLIFLITTLTICLLLPQILLITWQGYPLQILEIQKPEIVKQIIIIIASVISVLIFRKIPRFSTKSINLDLFQLSEITIRYLADKYKKENIEQEEAQQYSYLKPFIQNILHKITAFHNQQASIFMVVFLLISLIVTFMI